MNNNCKYCESCDSCYHCDYCYHCEYCNSCYHCYYCEYCNSCYHCNSCKYCKNLVNGFMCINLKFDKQDPSKYWIFNKEVTKEEWDNRFNIGDRLI